jgi:hypothetical protein
LDYYIGVDVCEIGIKVDWFVQFGKFVDSAELLLDVADAVDLDYLLVVVLGDRLFGWDERTIARGCLELC